MKTVNNPSLIKLAQPVRLFLVLLLASMSLFSYSTQSFAKQITVTTDRNSVEMGDIITLMVEADFQSRGDQIQLDQLRDQFEVLNQQQSNHFEMINGDFASFTRWQIQLLPKQAGKLIVPPFELDGVKSKPYEITVTEAKQWDQSKPLFLEGEVDKDKVHVQEQIIYTLRLFHKGSLGRGNSSIRPPEFGKSLVEPLNKDDPRPYGKTINGQQYSVYEWRYAVFPQSSGKLAFSRPSFNGLLYYKGGQKVVRAMAEPLNVEVLPKSESVDQSLPYWLPAGSVKLTQEWPKLPQTVHVGDSLKRIISLEVEGLKSSQLPEIKTQNDSNFKVYAETPQKSQQISTEGITSQLVLTEAIVPTKEGVMQIPNLEISWLNTRNGKIETAILETQSIEVWPSSHSIPQVVQSDQTGKLSSMGSQIDSNAPLSSKEAAYEAVFLNLNIWQLTAFIAILLWLSTLLLWYRSNHQIHRKLADLKQTNLDRQSEAKAPTVNKQWCQLPAKEFYPELLRQLHDDLNIPSVEQVTSQALKQAIQQLESHLFAEAELNKDTLKSICELWPSFSEQHQAKQHRQPSSSLNNLYSE